MRKTKRTSLLLLFALLLSACAGLASEEAAPPPDGQASAAQAATSAPTAEAPAEPVAISFGDLGSRRASYQPLIDRFNGENPGIHVEFVALDTTAPSSRAAALDTEAIARRVDVAALASLSQDDARRGLVLDLQPFIDGDASFERGDFFPAALGPAGGGIYVVPALLNLPLLQYNRDLWAGAGLPAPTLDWSADTFGAAIGELARRRGDEITTYGYVSRTGAVELVLSEVARTSAGPGAADSLRLDAPELAQALGRVAELAARGAVFVPGERGGGVGDYEAMRALIQAGRAGIWDAQINPFDAPPPFALGTAVVPSALARQQAAGEGYAISAGTLAPEAAWRWLSFLSRHAGEGLLASVRGPAAIPARRSAAEASRYWQSLDDEAAAAVRSVVEQPLASGNSAPFSHLVDPLVGALQAVLGGASPATAAREAQRALDQQRAQATASAEARAPVAPFVVEPPARAAQGAGAVTIVFGEPYATGQFDQLIKQFNQQNDDIVVELNSVPPAAGPARMADLAASSDCFLWWSRPTPEDAPALLDLQPLLDADASFPRDDYPPAILAAYRQGAALYGLPLEVTFPVLAYNTVIFERAGMQPPSAEWALGDLVDAAMKLTTGEGSSRQYGYSAAGSASTLYFLAHAGAALTSGEGDALQPNFTDPGVVQAIQSYVNLLKLASPNDRLDDYARDGGMAPSADALREQGRVGMWYQFGLSLGSFGLGDAQRFKPRVVPLPGMRSQGAALFEGNSLQIAAGAEQPQACWRLLSYLSSQPMGTTYGIPARLSVAESDAFLSGAPAGATELVAWYRAQGASAAPQPAQLSGMDLYWLHRAIDRALQGAALDRELDEAQQRTIDFLACVRAGQTKPSCAKQVDPLYNGWEI